jgi:hypothetical protein
MQQPACFAPDSCDHDQHTTVLVQNVFREVAWLAIITHRNGDGSSTPIPATAICLPAAPNLRRPFQKTRSAPDKETQLTSESARLLRVRETGTSQCSAIAEHNSLKMPGSATSAANLNLNQISPGCVKRPNCLARLNLRRWRLLLCCPDSAAQKRRPRLWIIRKSISPIAVRSWCPSLLLC